MATATMQYTVQAAIPGLSKAGNSNIPAVLEISYIDASGATQRVVGDSVASDYWTYSFVGTVGSQYYVAARDVQNAGIVTCTVIENGSQVATGNNSANTKIKAGVTGTI